MVILDRVELAAAKKFIAERPDTEHFRLRTIGGPIGDALMISTMELGPKSGMPVDEENITNVMTW